MSKNSSKIIFEKSHFWWFVHQKSRFWPRPDENRHFWVPELYLFKILLGGWKAMKSVLLAYELFVIHEYFIGINFRGYKLSRG